MARLDDVIAELEGQLASLKRQARQAARYRNLSGLIRKAEALAFYLRWNAAGAQGIAASDALQTANARFTTHIGASPTRLSRKGRKFQVVMWT